VEQSCALIREAGSNGAKLIVLPEVHIPGYPYWVWLSSPLEGFALFRRLYKNAVEVPSEATDRLCQAAKDADAYVVVGINEKTRVSMGAIYNTNLIIDRHGRLIGKHRKIVPTFAEKLVWASGDGSTLRVYDTTVGRIGTLACGENTNTLARFALLAQGEQVHTSNYPAFPIKRNYDIKRAIEIRAGAHAFEGKVFNIVACGAMSEEIIGAVGNSEETRRMLRTPGNAFSAIFGPDGECLGEPLIDREGIVYADIDIEESIDVKLFHDIVGNYNRFDIFSLNLNREPNLPLRELAGHAGKSFEPAVEARPTRHEVGSPSTVRKRMTQLAAALRARAMNGGAVAGNGGDGTAETDDEIELAWLLAAAGDEGAPFELHGA
jgi:predicted amidohydrolase